MLESFSIFDIIILGGGIYLLFSSIGMITKGRIPGILLSKGMVLTKEADVPGFVRAMTVPTILMGICSLASGALGIACKYIPGLNTLQFVVLMLAFLLLIVYGYVDVRAQKKYLKIK